MGSIEKATREALKAYLNGRGLCILNGQDVSQRMALLSNQMIYIKPSPVLCERIFHSLR
jgi:hypothetical protein